MGLQNIIQLFVPKNKIFFTLFEQLTATSTQMSKIFIDCVNEKDISKRADIIKQIEKYEHDNDETTHQLFVELGKNFITPLDREDIHALASSLDDVSDYICGAARIMQTYNITELPENVHAMALLIDRGTNEIKKAVSELRNLKNVRAIADSCIKVNSIENEADHIFERSISDLFENEKDVVKILKMKDLLENMENCTDKCEDVANVIESIIIKYA